jgi:hypothetical protein
VTKDAFLQQVSSAEGKIAEAKTHLERIILALCSNFNTAYDGHVAFLKSMHKVEGVDTAFLFEIALTLVAGAVGGKVAALVKDGMKDTTSNFVKFIEPSAVDASKDVTKLFVKHAGSLAAPKQPSTTPAFQTLPPDPSKWSDAILSWIYNDIEYMQHITNGWRDAAAHPEKYSNFKMDFDPLQLILQMLVIRSDNTNALLHSPHLQGATRHGKVIASQNVVSILSLPLYVAQDPEQIRAMQRAMFGSWVKTQFFGMTQDEHIANMQIILNYASSIRDTYNYNYLDNYWKNSTADALDKAMKKYEHPPAAAKNYY